MSKVSISMAKIFVIKGFLGIVSGITLLVLSFDKVILCRPEYYFVPLISWFDNIGVVVFEFSQS